MNTFETQQRIAESMSTERLESALAYYQMKLEVAGSAADAYIRMCPSVHQSNDVWFDYDDFLKEATDECRRFATTIRAISEELAIRPVEGNQ